MQHQIKILLTLALIIALSATKGQTNFRETSFQEGVSEANSEGKLLFVDAYTDWCGWCKVMDRETFSTEEIGKFMNEKFVSIKVNMEEGFGIDLAMKYRVSSYPHYLIFDQSGQLLAKFGGYLEPEPFKEKVNTVLLPENQLPLLENPMDFDLGFPDFYRNSFKKRQERSYPSAEELIAYLNEHPDVTDIATWGVVYRFVNDGPYVENIVANKDALVEKYGPEDVMAKLSRIVFTEVKAAIKSEDEGAFKSALQSADKLLGEEAEDYKLRYRLYYYQMTGQWDEYANLGTTLASENLEENAASLNQIAWTLFENCEAT
jgi:thioredoxin-related protein